jgi:hypothetical protein
MHEGTTGESNSQVLLSVPDMMSWKFYDTIDDWHSALAEYESSKATLARCFPRSTNQGFRPKRAGAGSAFQQV